MKPLVHQHGDDMMQYEWCELESTVQEQLIVTTMRRLAQAQKGQWIHRKEVITQLAKSNQRYTLDGTCIK